MMSGRNFLYKALKIPRFVKTNDTRSLWPPDLAPGIAPEVAREHPKSPKDSTGSHAPGCTCTYLFQRKGHISGYVEYGLGEIGGCR